VTSITLNHLHNNKLMQFSQIHGAILQFGSGPFSHGHAISTPSAQTWRQVEPNHIVDKHFPQKSSLLKFARGLSPGADWDENSYRAKFVRAPVLQGL
jgi:hypothetical protein